LSELQSSKEGTDEKNMKKGKYLYKKYIKELIKKVVSMKGKKVSEKISH
jgi:hypothetical protein